MNYYSSPKSLQDLSVYACAQYLSLLPTLNKEHLFRVHRYLQLASPLIQKVAKKSHYYFSGRKTLIFLPFLQKELILTDQNINEITVWCDRLHQCDQEPVVFQLDKLIVNAPKPENYFKFLPFVSKIPFVTKLELNTWTNDDVLATVIFHCKQLEVLDARGDTETLVTDVGLGFLSHCKTLKMVLFSRIPDEYDFEDKFKFTGKGIALLMLSLNKLERVECPEYLIRDSLHYIYQMGFQNPALTLKCLFLAYPDVPVKTINILPFLCPHLETLSLYIPSGKEFILKNSLKYLLNLKKLKLKFEDTCKAESVNFVDCQFQTEYLIIDVQYLQEEDIYHISINFSNLKILVLVIHSFGFVPKLWSKVECNPLSYSFFRNLHTLQIHQRISGNLFKLLNIRIKNLRALYLEDAVIYDVHSAIEYIITEGGWAELVILVFPHNCYFSSRFLFENLSKIKNRKLRFIAAKLADNGRLEERLFVNQLHNILNIQLCSVDDLPGPSKEFCGL